MGRWIGLAVAVLAAIALVIALGERDPRVVTDAPVPPPTLVPAPPATSVPEAPSTTTVAPAPEPAAAERPLRTPEDAERLLADAGIDPATLSEEIGDYMDRRFEEHTD